MFKPLQRYKVDGKNKVNNENSLGVTSHYTKNKSLSQNIRKHKEYLGRGQQ